MSSPQRQVIVKPYDPGWSLAYRKEEEVLRRVFGPTLVRIEHIGSTSVPNMSAKPIIDVLIEARSLAEIDLLTGEMQALGYVAKGEQGVPGRRYFRKGPDADHTHHVHVFAAGDSNVAELLAFRDYLAANEQRATEYARLKTDLALRFPEDPKSYHDAKAPLVELIIREALAWAAGRPASP